MVTTLSTRTTVLGATNPRPNWNSSQPLSAATNLSGPLLSRFDIVMLLLDTRHPEWDKVVSNHVLTNHQMVSASVARGTCMHVHACFIHMHLPVYSTSLSPWPSGLPWLCGIPDPFPSTRAHALSAHLNLVTTHPLQGGMQAHGSTSASGPGASGWSLEVLQQYLMWAKTSFHPVMSPEAEQVILTYYQALRRDEDRNAARTTIRMLESLVRVAQVSGWGDAELARACTVFWL